MNRKSKVKRVIRVPAVSSKMADIPSDEFSWRKYGQKPIKGSPHPRLVFNFIFLIVWNFIFKSVIFYQFFFKVFKTVF